jgi:H+/Cl- antiporter ClcA
MFETVRTHWQNEEIRKATYVSVVLGALSSAASGVALVHMEPTRDPRKEIWTSTLTGIVTGVASLAFMVYMHEKRLKEEDAGSVRST